MKNKRIILEDEYFIEVGPLNWTLKKNRPSKKSKEKVLGHYGSLEKAILSYKEELINRVCLKRDKNVLIEELIELLHQVENHLNHAVNTLKIEIQRGD